MSRRFAGLLPPPPVLPVHARIHTLAWFQGTGGIGACRMVFSDYAPLDHVLPRYLSVALLRRLNRRNIKTVGHSSLRWVGAANQRAFTPPPPPDGGVEVGAGGATAAVTAEHDGGDSFDGVDEDAAEARSGPVVLPPPPSLTMPSLGPSGEAPGAGAAAVAELAVADGRGDQQKRRKQRRLQIMTAHSFDHLDTATHSTDRVVLAGVVRERQETGDERRRQFVFGRSNVV